MALDSQNMRAHWKEFFEAYDYLPRIAEISQDYPEKRSLYVEEREIHQYNPEFLQEILSMPTTALQIGRDVILELMPAPEENIDPHKLWLRINPSPPTQPIPIRDLRETNLYKFITVEGLLRRVTEVRPRLLVGAFQCKSCTAIMYQHQESSTLTLPAFCDQKRGGCGKTAQQTEFVLIPEESKFIDQQKIEIQESPEKMPRGGVQPQRLLGVIEDDICGEVFPGDRVQLAGILHAIQRNKYRTTEFEILLNVNSLRKLSKEYSEIELTKEEIEEIEREARQPDVFEKIVHSISPTIAGMEKAKQAIALQLVGGVTKVLEDGVRRKGDIHILLVGDPGTAKSQILTFVSRIVPRGIYAVGKSTSAAGLTAAAVKDEFGEGRWTLEAGALVLADTGIACIDELDKMSKEDRSAMHEALEQQTVTVSKAGIYATLNTRCPVLAAANPKDGRFDPNRPVFDQIDLPQTLISRFDIIIPIVDRPQTEVDQKIASHIIKAHYHGEILVSKEMGDDRKVDDASSADLVPPYTMEFLKKYISYARKIVPTLSEEAKKTILERYLEIRKQGEGEENAPVPITPRQLEAMIRLSEAAAKLRLSNVVTEEDAALAVGIFMSCFREVATDRTTNRLDSDLISTGIPKSKRDELAIVRDIIREFEGTSGGSEGVSFDDLDRICEERHGISGDRLKDILEMLKHKGEIYEPRDRHYRRIRE